MARVLILQDPAGAARSARLLRDFGHEPLLLPLQTFRPLEPAPMRGAMAAIALTSTRAVPYLARHYAGTPAPILTVGVASAKAARQAGFDDVRPGEGQAETLAGPLAALAEAARAPILFLAGRVRTPALEDALRAQGVPMRVLEVYDTMFVEPEASALHALAEGEPVEAVLLLSVGQARAFQALCERLPDAWGAQIRALCLSPRIAAALSGPRRADAVVGERGELSTLLSRYA